MNHQGVWALEATDGRVSTARLSKGCRLLHGCVLLRFAIEGSGERAVLVLADHAVADEFKQLRRLLRVHATQLTAAKE